MFHTDASYLLSKTPEDIEEEKAIKEMCYKSGKNLIVISTKNIGAFFKADITIAVSFFFFCLFVDETGEYYRIQTSQENNLTKNYSVLENELIKPMETCRELQEGKE